MKQPVADRIRQGRIVGKAVAEAGARDRVILATKGGLDWGGATVFRNGSADRIITEIMDSLRQLRKSYIDLYQAHWPDLRPMEETATAQARLRDQGKIRAIGVSNFSRRRWRDSSGSPRSTSCSCPPISSNGRSRRTCCPMPGGRGSRCSSTGSAGDCWLKLTK